MALVASPGVTALEARGVARPLAIAAVVIGGLLVIGALVYWIGMSLVPETGRLAEELPRWGGEVERLYRHALQPALGSRGVHVQPGDVPMKALTSQMPALLFSGVTQTVQGVIDAVVVLVSCVWLLGSARTLRAGLLSFFDEPQREAVAFGVDTVVTVLGGYVRAQLFMALLIGVLAGTGCALLGVPFPIVIAVVAAVFELIPIVGPFAGGAVALLLAVTVSWWLVLWTLLLFLGIHAIEGYVLAPRVQARFVRVHPFIAFLAVFAGIEVGGFVGALFAVPVVSMLAVLLRTALAVHRAGDVAPLRERHQRLEDEFRVFDLEHRVRRLARRLRGTRGREPERCPHVEE